MRNDFAIFILTHGRADNVITYKTLKESGYTGKVYLIIDNEDDQADKYINNFGKENVIVFDKQAVYDRIDTCDNFNNHKAIVYARNACYEIAKQLGLTYFLQLDDDYNRFRIRYAIGETLSDVKITHLDEYIDPMIDFLESSGAKTIAMSQGGDFIGGIESAVYKKRLARKAMNAFFCKTDRPINFIGTMNEDVTAYTLYGSQGNLFFTLADFSINQLATQSLEGGMSEAYKESGTYVKSMYSVMAMPSCVSISTMGVNHRRIHHRINWDCCAPMIINEKWKK